MREGRNLREDLFYRLNVVNVNVPPLRERLGDVRLLSDYFKGVYCEKNGKEVNGFTEEAMQLLENHVWPGNVRELENVVERAVITAQDAVISARDVALERRPEAQALVAEARRPLKKLGSRQDFGRYRTQRDHRSVDLSPG